MLLGADGLVVRSRVSLGDGMFGATTPYQKAVMKYGEDMVRNVRLLLGVLKVFMYVVLIDGVIWATDAFDVQSAADFLGVV